MKRGRSVREVPPPLELACLQELWNLGEGTVQEVKESLGKSRELAYTTVMTMLDRLVRKQAATRRKQGRCFVYTPLLTREEARRRALRQLLDSLFGGSSSEFSAWLSGGQSVAATSTEAEEPRAIDTTLL